MDQETKIIIEKLQERISELEFKVDSRWEIVKKNVSVIDDKVEEKAETIRDILELIIKNSESLAEKQEALKIITEQILRLDTEMMKYSDVYYHVFPERKGQDVQVFKQIESLTVKPDTDASRFKKW